MFRFLPTDSEKGVLSCHPRLAVTLSFEGEEYDKPYKGHF